MKKLFDRIKLFIDAWKMWLFFGVLVGTNAGQQIYYSEPIEEKEPLKAAFVAKSPTKPPETIIIHKVDNSYCDKLINDHKNGSQH